MLKLSLQSLVGCNYYFFLIRKSSLTAALSFANVQYVHPNSAYSPQYSCDNQRAVRWKQQNLILPLRGAVYIC